MVDHHHRKAKRSAYERALDRYFSLMPVFPHIPTGDRPAPPEPPTDL